MKLVHRLKTVFQWKHLHPVASTLILIFGTYYFHVVGLNTADPSRVDGLVVLASFATIPHLLWYGFISASWRELTVMFVSGATFSAVLSTSVVNVAAGYDLFGPEEFLFQVVPSGAVIYSLSNGVLVLTITLLFPFLIRGVYLLYGKWRGDGGIGTIHEKEVLSEEEWEEFDHPTKELRKILAILVSPITGPNRKPSSSTSRKICQRSTN